MFITIDYFKLIFVKSCECVRECVSHTLQSDSIVPNNLQIENAYHRRSTCAPNRRRFAPGEMALSLSLVLDITLISPTTKQSSSNRCVVQFNPTSKFDLPTRRFPSPSVVNFLFLILVARIHNARNEVRNEEGCDAINPAWDDASACRDACGNRAVHRLRNHLSADAHSDGVCRATGQAPFRGYSGRSQKAPSICCTSLIARRKPRRPRRFPTAPSARIRWRSARSRSSSAKGSPGTRWSRKAP